MFTLCLIDMFDGSHVITLVMFLECRTTWMPRSPASHSMQCTAKLHLSVDACQLAQKSIASAPTVARPSAPVLTRTMFLLTDHLSTLGKCRSAAIGAVVLVYHVLGLTVIPLSSSSPPPHNLQKPSCR